MGCVAGPERIMASLAPAGPVYQAGTLSGNPVAMEAGLAQLCKLQRLAREHDLYGSLAPSQFEALFISAAHTRSELERFIEAAERVLKGLGKEERAD